MKKISMSRFQIHDELTAPESSIPVLRGALAGGGRLPNFLGVLAGPPAALRGYAGFRSELRHGALGDHLERIALAVADRHQSARGSRCTPEPRARRAQARRAGPGPRGDSRDEREATLLRYLEALVEGEGKPPMHLHQEAREAGWSDEQILEAVAVSRARGLHRHGQRRRRSPGRRLRPRTPGRSRRREVSRQR